MNIRLLMNMYTNHVTHVSWNHICSDFFMIGNDVKQGGVILFFSYIENLLGPLKNSTGRVFL